MNQHNIIENIKTIYVEEKPIIEEIYLTETDRKNNKNNEPIKYNLVLNFEIHTPYNKNINTYEEYIIKVEQERFKKVEEKTYHQIVL